MLISALVLISCTSNAGSEIASVAPRLGAPTSTGSTNDLTFRPVGQIDVDGENRLPPDAASAPTPQGDGNATCAPGLAIGIMGPLTGHASVLGRPILNGAVAATTRFTAANPGCPLTVKQFDTRTSDVDTIVAAESILADRSVIAVIGPVLSHELDLVGDRLATSGLVVASPSATDPGLTTHRWPDFVRGLPNDEQLAEAGANYLTKRLGLARICVLEQDFKETQAAADIVRRTLGAAVIPGCDLIVGQTGTDFRTEIGVIRDAEPDGVYVAGYAPQAASFVRQLRQDGVGALVLGWEGVLDERFTHDAGDAARGVLVISSYSPPSDDFRTAYRQTWATEPVPYAMEAYELATIMVHGIGSGAAVDRASMRDYIRNYSGAGSSRRYGWQSSGELAAPDLSVYEVG